MPKFILASASPARLKLLQRVGINPLVEHSNFDESQVEIFNPTELVNTLAFKKAEKVAISHSDALILGCDSMLFVKGKIYGKPESKAQAITRWQEMRGNQGMLYTGHALLDLTKNKTVIRCGVTKVYFSPIDDDTIKAYVESGEPLKCAGGFGLEGKGGLFIEKIEGCYSNVIGLSYPLLRQMLEHLGYQITDFWPK